MTDVATKPRPGTSLRGFSAPLLLVLGVVIVPVVITLLSNSWSAPDDAAYVRMAFASVAGATIAIVTVVGLLVDRIVRRATVATIAIFAVIALVVVPWQWNAISNAADVLLTRLSGAAPGLPEGWSGPLPDPATGDPVVGWIGEDRFGVITMGSSSCPPLPSEPEVIGPDEIRIAFAPSPNDPCTADMAPTAHEFTLPDGVTGRPVVVTLTYSGYDGVDQFELR